MVDFADREIDAKILLELASDHKHGAGTGGVPGKNTADNLGFKGFWKDPTAPLLVLAVAIAIGGLARPLTPLQFVASRNHRVFFQAVEMLLGQVDLGIPILNFSPNRVLANDQPIIDKVQLLVIGQP